jgi:hypothetical protein
VVIALVVVQVGRQDLSGAGRGPAPTGDADAPNPA